MKQHKRLNLQKKLRIKRSRAGIFGTPAKPRLSIFRSNKFISAQLIDDQNQKTLISSSTRSLINGDSKQNLSKTLRAEQLGKILAEAAKKAGISKVVFDRRGYKFHGRVRAVAESARKNGLEF